jgi:hypothetical protein
VIRADACPLQAGVWGTQEAKPGSAANRRAKYFGQAKQGRAKARPYTSTSVPKWDAAVLRLYIGLLLTCT